MSERVSTLDVPGGGAVTALLREPPGARGLYVFGHGAGAGMRHAFMDAVAARLAGVGVATLRYQFPYMERGSKRPDARPVLLATVRAAVAAAAAQTDLPVWAGGKSMGGRMTSLAQAEAPLPGVERLVFFGYPLHPAGRPSTERAAHLSEVDVPMLFLQGERDALGAPGLLASVLAGMDAPSTLHVLAGADHGFHTRKKDGRTGDEVLDEAVATFAAWTAGAGS